MNKKCKEKEMWRMKRNRKVKVNIDKAEIWLLYIHYLKKKKKNIIRLPKVLSPLIVFIISNITDFTVVYDYIKILLIVVPITNFISKVLISLLILEIFLTLLTFTEICFLTKQYNINYCMLEKNNIKQCL